MLARAVQRLTCLHRQEPCPNSRAHLQPYVSQVGALSAQVKAARHDARARECGIARGKPQAFLDAHPERRKHTLKMSSSKPLRSRTGTMPTNGCNQRTELWRKACRFRF